MDAYSVRSRTKFIQMGLHMIVLLQLTSYLWPPDTQITDVKPCYDFIIVGCGTAGSILANRLSESGEYQVLVIEAGGDPPIESLVFCGLVNIGQLETFDLLVHVSGVDPNEDCTIAGVLRTILTAKSYPILDPFATRTCDGTSPQEVVATGIQYPGTYTYLPNSKYDWNFTAVDDGYTAQARIHHMLQLTSGKMLGGSSSLGHLLYVRGNPHGYNNWGEIVNDESWAFNDLLNFFKKSEKLDYKDIVYPGNDYYHGTNGPLGVTRIVNHISQKYLNLFKDLGHAVLTDGNGNKSLGYFEPMFMTKDRVRQSASYAFLTPTKTRKNLHLLKEAEVIKINFNNLIAYSVTAIKNDKKITFKATREIIVAAGAIKTAHLLMLSGIGLNEHLDANGIPVKNDLPVGKYYQDHLGVFLVHKFNITSLKSPPIVNPYEVPVNMIIGNVAVDKRKFNPEYQTVNYIIPSDSNSLLSLCSLDNTFANEVCNSLYRETKGYETMVSIIVLLHPKSRGHVALQNNDYRKPPIIISGFYSDEDDLKNMTNYILDFLQIAKTSMFKKYGGSLVLPKLRGCEIYTGVPYWKCYSLNMMVTRHHYSSTCAMGKVVDKNLKVIGVSGLRVVDASVIPLLPSGSIQAAVMAIAEKGSDMILSDAKRLYPPKCKT